VLPVTVEPVVTDPPEEDNATTLITLGIVGVLVVFVIEVIETFEMKNSASWL
jgi:hypothetical protein